MIPSIEKSEAASLKVSSIKAKNLGVVVYILSTHDRTNRWMLILETTIVLLFIIDLVLLVVGLKNH